MKAAEYVAMMPVCPKCDTGLFSLRFKSVEVDYCEGCRGVWLDAGEWEQLAGVALPALRRTAGTQHLCPRCDARLEEVTAPDHLTLDRCPRGHGLWFDADELQQLLATTHGAALTELFNIGGK